MSTYLYEVTESTLPTIKVGDLVVDDARGEAATRERTWHIWNPLTRHMGVAYSAQLIARVCWTCRHAHSVVALAGHLGPCPGPAYAPDVVMVEPLRSAEEVAP